MIGKPNHNYSNVLWVVHPFTADTRVSVWWDSLFGANKVFDTKKYCIICPNIPGSPYGSTYPLSINPETNKKYFYDFPIFTPRDIADMFEFLRIHLHIPQIDIVLGASMGGQIAVQWGVAYPRSMKHLFVIAADVCTSPWLSAMHVVQRKIIEIDASWGEEHDEAGMRGMGVARQMAVISYRAHRIFDLSQSQDKIIANKADEAGGHNTFENVNSYLQYQGDTFLSRFNAFSYTRLLEMMNHHDISKGFFDMKEALSRIEANSLFIGIDSDVIFPANEIQKQTKHIKKVVYKEISSVYGHDAFFIESKQLEDIVQNYFYIYGG